MLAAVVVAFDFDALAGASEAEPLQELLRAGPPQGFLVAVGAGDVPVVGALAEDGLGAAAYLLVEGLGGFGVMTIPAWYWPIPAGW